MAHAYSRIFWLFFGNALASTGQATSKVTPLHRRIVEQWGAMSEEAFADVVAQSKRLPGVTGLNLAVSLGHALRGWWGAVMAVCGCVLPALLGGGLAILLLRWTSGDAMWQYFWMGVRAAALGLLIVPCFRLGYAAKVSWVSLWWPLLVATLVVVFRLSPFLVVAIMALAGFLLGQILRRQMGKKNA